MMSVYQTLAEFLDARNVDRWEASFAEVEAVLRRRLPPSAHRHQAWWANQSGAGHSQTIGWRSVGWRTTRVDLERQRVTFERDRKFSEPKQPSASAASLVEQAMRLTGITDREAVVDEALRALIARETGRVLAELGGAMPDYRAPDRERP